MVDMQMLTNHDEPVGDGIYLIVGESGKSGEELAQWEYWLTLCRVLTMPRPVIPTNACMALVAMIDHMESVKLGACAGLIVVAGEPRENNEPFVTLHDYKLIMQALMEGKKVYTSRPLCPVEKFDERMWPLDCMDPKGPTELFEFTWEDYRAKFGRKVSPAVLADNGEKPIS